jgi:hypothetical protein
VPINLLLLAGTILTVYAAYVRVPLILLAAVFKKNVKIRLQDILLWILLFYIISLVVFKRSYFDTASIGLVIDLFIALLVVFTFTGYEIKARYCDILIFLICISNFIIMSLYYVLGVKVLPYYIFFGGNSDDLFKGLIFRTPGIFNEPSTMCYTLLFLYIFSTQSKSIILLIFCNVVMSTSFGGIISFLILIAKRSRLVFFGILSMIITTIIFPIISGIPYLSDRLERITRGEDGSVSNRLESLLEFDITFWGMQANTIESLYQYSSVKGLGYISNIIAYTGIFGLMLIICMVLYQKQSFERLLYLSFSKFDLLEPINIVALIVKRTVK